MTAFGDAFKAARKKAGGGGGTFKFRGKSYNTKIREEVSKPAYDIKKPTGGGPAMRKGVTSAKPAKNNSGVTGGMKSHPAPAAVGKANAKNTAPGAPTKFQFDGPPTLLTRPGAGTPSLLKRGK